MGFWENIKNKFKKRKSSLLIISTGIIALGAGAVSVIKYKESKLNTSIVKAEERIQEIKKQLPPKGLKLDKGEKKEVQEKNAEIKQLRENEKQLESERQEIKQLREKIKLILRDLEDMEKSFKNQKVNHKVAINIDLEKGITKNVKYILDIFSRFTEDQSNLFYKLENLVDPGINSLPIPNYILDDQVSLMIIYSIKLQMEEPTLQNLIQTSYHVALTKMDSAIQAISKYKQTDLKQWVSLVAKLLEILNSSPENIREQLSLYIQKADELRRQIENYEQELNALLEYLNEAKAEIEKDAKYKHGIPTEEELFQEVQ